MARKDDYYVNSKGETVSALDTDDGLTVWNHEHATEIGTANTDEDVRNMLDG